jgi:hypothetical protein
MFYEGPGAGAGAAAAAPYTVEGTIDFLKGLAFEIDVEKTPVSYVFEADESDMQLRQLITVNATKADGTPYWSQVFYRSSGTSSKSQETWFPVVAITPRVFVKGIPHIATWFHEHDKMWNPRFPSSGDLPKRFLMFSFLLASNQLEEIKKETINKLWKELQPVKKDILTALKGLLNDPDMQSKLKTFIPKDPTLLKESSPGSYEKINMWIGGDNYTGRPARDIAANDETGLFLGGKRRPFSSKRKHTKKRCIMRRNTRRHRK